MSIIYPTLNEWDFLFSTGFLLYPADIFTEFFQNARMKMFLCFIDEQHSKITNVCLRGVFERIFYKLVYSTEKHIKKEAKPPLFLLFSYY